ncbi:MAG: MBL fold metallo-hydrolase [Alphaproteobacteria bacterium]|nr:MBL fold metallo-hydrolase [Alphaproteobacteria bacterium]
MAGVVLVGVAGTFAWLFQDMTLPQGERIEAIDGVVGVETSGSFAWIVPAGDGVVLVDAGADPDAEALLAELGRQGRDAGDVRAVLLTHAHGDHTGGLRQFPQAEIWIGADDVALLRKERTPIGWIPRMMAPLFDAPVPDNPLEEFADGDTHTVAGLTVKGTAVPGHTLGSMAWQVGDLLFTGDALVAARDGVTVLFAWIADAPERQVPSVRRLVGVEAAMMADGHFGLTPEPADAIDRFLAARQ